MACTLPGMQAAGGGVSQAWRAMQAAEAPWQPLLPLMRRLHGWRPSSPPGFLAPFACACAGLHA